MQIQRVYRLHERIGRGGFGSVYRATLEGGAGFEKTVAIKLLNPGRVPEEELQRFRDEARVLGLVRDRAIVAVEPPIEIDGQWAIVMDYVDGRSLGSVLKAVRPPPEVALEVVAEVARALDTVYNQTGPDGEPLALIHRDLKPANLQLTPSGEVRILDFGIAKANFEAREFKTVDALVGTPGYIAPERFEGHESDRVDIYSLGRILAKMVDPEDGSALGLQTRALIDEMTSDAPEDRPDAEEVESRASRLFSRFGEISLRDWCAEHVEPAEHVTDERNGSTIVENREVDTPPRRWRGIAAGCATWFAVLACLGVLGSGTGLYALRQVDAPVVAVDLVCYAEEDAALYESTMVRVREGLASIDVPEVGRAEAGLLGLPCGMSLLRVPSYESLLMELGRDSSLLEDVRSRRAFTKGGAFLQLADDPELVEGFGETRQLWYYLTPSEGRTDLEVEAMALALASGLESTGRATPRGYWPIDGPGQIPDWGSGLLIVDHTGRPGIEAALEGPDALPLMGTFRTVVDLERSYRVWVGPGARTAPEP